VTFKTRIQVLLLACLATLPTLLRFPRDGSSEEAGAAARVARGRLAYGIHCASCHGDRGGGDGPMAGLLKIPPADLTRLAARGGGRFPAAGVYASIDGRQEISGHGPGSMPVWGLSFQTRGLDAPQEEEVRGRIQDIVAFLESIQERGGRPPKTER
jgi:mono/diheme cytochrome c family protein